MLRVPLEEQPTCSPLRTRGRPLSARSGSGGYELVRALPYSSSGHHQQAPSRPLAPGSLALAFAISSVSVLGFNTRTSVNGVTYPGSTDSCGVALLHRRHPAGPPPCVLARHLFRFCGFPQTLRVQSAGHSPTRCRSCSHMCRYAPPRTVQHRWLSSGFSTL